MRTGSGSGSGDAVDPMVVKVRLVPAAGMVQRKERSAEERRIIMTFGFPGCAHTHRVGNYGMLQILL